MSNFTIYDPVAQLVATTNNGGGGSGGLPLSGGTLTGNLNMDIPAKIIQCQTPSDSCDLVNLIYLQQTYLSLDGGTMTGPIIQAFPPSSPNELVNKAYVDGLISDGPFLPLAGGVMSGTISQPLAPVATSDLVNKDYVDRTFKYGSYLFKSTSPIVLNSAATSNALSTGNGTIGPDTWSDPNISCTIDNNGVVTIINNLSSITYFKLTFNSTISDN